MDMRTWRKSNSVILVALAEAVASSKGYLSDIEQGERRPSPGLAKRIDAATNGEVTAAELLGLAPTCVREESRDFDHASSLLIKVRQTDLEDVARFGLDPKAIAERAVAEQVKEARIARRNEENREAIESWNELVKKEGLWSDGLRPF